MLVGTWMSRSRWLTGAVRANKGALMRGPHAGFLNGTAKIYVQHVCKAAGTTLCALLRANANATVHDCQPPAPISDRGPDQPIRQSTEMRYKDPTRHYMANVLRFGSLEKVASYLDKEGLEVVASESNHMPAYVDDHLGGADPSWVLLASSGALHASEASTHTPPYLARMCTRRMSD